jgi:demethylmenaquinone methyltransferase/2-methoxy-6-polyprenyl-1,4-benzoquinol methylase
MVHVSTADKPWAAEGQEKRAAVQSMFAEIAPTYDLCNALMSLSLHRRWRAWASSRLELHPGGQVLDLCSGTGDFLKPLREAVGSDGLVLGADFCLPMLARAADKPANLLVLADAGRIPLSSERFDGVSVGWGIRNVPDADLAHREIARILKPGGRFVSLDMARPRNGFVRGISEAVFNHAIPLLGALFRKRKAYTYLPKSTAGFKSREELKTSMEAAGFVEVGYRDFFMGNICVHWGTKR